MLDSNPVDKCKYQLCIGVTNDAPQHPIDFLKNILVLNFLYAWIVPFNRLIRLPSIQELVPWGPFHKTAYDQAQD